MKNYSFSTTHPAICKSRVLRRGATFQRSMILLGLLGAIAWSSHISPIRAGDPSLKTELVSPKDVAVFDNYPRSATFSWKAVFGASKYYVEVQCSVKDMDTGKSTWILFRKSYVTDTQFSIDTFVGAQAGRWRVTAYDAGGGAGDSSEWRTFRFTR
jgi:hypothetical protein